MTNNQITKLFTWHSLDDCPCECINGCTFEEICSFIYEDELFTEHTTTIDSLELHSCYYSPRGYVTVTRDR